ncbi:GNAT family N-acetyltransferase [Alkaliphilus hydrothermalis]|uniref:Ribosomal protein S18 acetylase RimI-like enzyme n=1 Tax=Alkaliphilus hydrothermalis TaxID=1482730 RepID=A0ABS2NLJ5_9FIRM|nr:GNAT family N-acetyltransferase [Alkaliphilus hydrothermalis]MBM7613795.1 ribosomal protein S18 acetylase RimI-like enzyme [Alkaliphilus hydrothermalis]
MEIRLVEDAKEKSMITEKVLRQLPHWFGQEEPLVKYVNTVYKYPFYAAFVDNEAVGFISIKDNNQYTAEIYVMGILEGHHRRGIGKGLLQRAEEGIKDKAYKYLMVKTVGESSPDLYYARTRKYYEGVGFYPLEELKDLWDEQNPCLILVKNL